MPYAAGETGTAFEEGYAFQQDLTVAQAGLERAFLRKPGQVKPELIEGKLPLEMSFLTFEGNGIHMTAFKKGQKKDDLFVRFVNHMEPVSYTHLDVYKRQAHWCSRSLEQNGRTAQT